MLDFHDKIVFITGTGGHIGAVTADLFLKQGARVISTDVTYADKTPSRIDFDANPVKIGLDVTDAHMVREIIDLTVEKYGRLDVAVNAAGILHIKPILELTEADWDKILAVNLKGLFFVCQAALRHMLIQKRGNMVNFASISGKVGGILAGADYSASKAAVICLTKSLAKAGAAHGIRANSVAPGATESPMLDLYYENYAAEMAQAESGHIMKRFGQAEEVAHAVLFLASDEASYINGVCVDVNGGARMD